MPSRSSRFSPGWYKVVNDIGATSTREQSIHSEDVREYPKDTLLQIDNVVHLKKEKRHRGQLTFSKCWISIVEVAGDRTKFLKPIYSKFIPGEYKFSQDTQIISTFEPVTGSQTCLTYNQNENLEVIRTQYFDSENKIMGQLNSLDWVTLADTKTGQEFAVNWNSNFRDSEHLQEEINDSSEHRALAALNFAIEERDVNLTKFILAPIVHGKENILNVLVNFWDNQELAKEIYAFIDWNLDKQTLIEKDFVGKMVEDEDYFDSKMLPFFLPFAKNPTKALFSIVTEEAYGWRFWSYRTSRFDDEKNEIFAQLLKHTNLNVVSVLLSILNLDEEDDVDYELDENDFKNFFSENVIQKHSNWFSQNAFEYLVKHPNFFCVESLQLLVQNCLTVGIDLIQLNKSNGVSLIETASSKNKYEIIKYLVDNAGFPVSENAIAFVDMEDWDAYGLKRFLTKKLREQNRLQKRAAKRRKLN